MDAVEKASMALVIDSLSMVPKKQGELYQCEECGFAYAEKEWAEKCEAWCKERHSCNLEITSHGKFPLPASAPMKKDST